MFQKFVEIALAPSDRVRTELDARWDRAGSFPAIERRAADPEFPCSGGGTENALLLVTPGDIAIFAIRRGSRCMDGLWSFLDTTTVPPDEWT